MPGNFKKEDLRIVKTYRALTGALVRLLNKRKYIRLTVNDLCEEAEISRATFYAHFKDKFDLLEYWLRTLQVEFSSRKPDNELWAKGINTFMREHKKVIANLLEDANDEICEIVRRFMMACMDFPALNAAEDKGYTKNSMIVTFCAGGLFNLLLWQKQNKFPPESEMVDKNLIELLERILEFADK